jgi:hypothetical protein
MRAAAALAGVHDAAVLDLDPGLEAVDEPEAVGRLELVQVAELLGWWRVVVGDVEPERQAVEALHRSLGDPRQRRDRGRNVHGTPPELAHDQAGCRWAPRC